MENNAWFDFLKRLAKGLAAQFGKNCEVVVHDMSAENTILAIENGHVTNRKVGDGPSHVVLDALRENRGALEDRVAYLTRTQDGKVLKSTTIYVRDERNAVIGILSINYDISELLVAQQAVGALLEHADSKPEEPQTATRIPQNVNDLLLELIEESVQVAGKKPPAMMSKEEKMKAIRFLSDAGAFLITKSGDQISSYFGISKYTMYSYFDAKNERED